jgi:hypothetical protein
MYFQFYDTLLSEDYLSDIGDRYFTEYEIERTNDFEESNEFLVYVINLFTIETTNIYKKLEHDILKAESKEKQESLILFMINSIDEYKEKLSGESNFDLIFDEFEIDLNRLHSKINRRFSHLIPTKAFINTSNPITPKIQWIGDIKVLGTLFYDLLNGQDNDKGYPRKKALIKGRIIDIQTLLLNNFSNKDGKALSKRTIEGCFNKSRPTERVDYPHRIELPK